MSFLKKKMCLSILVMLLLIILVDCAPLGSKTSAPKATSSSPTVQSSTQPSITPSLVAEWNLGYVNDVAWSPNSKIFAANSRLEGDELNNVQAFDVKSPNRIWIAENSITFDLAFNLNGQLFAESDPIVGSLYLRSAEQGNLVRQIQSNNCTGGQFILFNPGGTTFLVADIRTESGVTAIGDIYFSLWDSATGQCKNLLHYGGDLHLFDVNTSGNLIVYGGVSPDDHAVIWDEKKQAEVCRTKADFGRFVPGQNTLAITLDQKLVFIDASTCHELRELNISLSFPTYLAFSPDGQWFAVARQSIQIIETATGRTVAQVPLPESAGPTSNHGGLNSGLVFSPDGRYLLLAFSTNANDSYSGKVQLWQLLR